MSLRTSQLVTRLKFAAGSAPGASPLVITPSPICVLVGPNNSGKSLALRNFARALEQPYHDPGLVLPHVEIRKPSSREEFEDFIRSAASRRSEDPDNTVFPSSPTSGTPLRYGTTALFQSWHDQKWWHTFIGNAYMVNLDGRSRLTLVNARSVSDLMAPADSHFATLFQNPTRRAELRDYVHAAIGKYLVIDPTNVGSLRMRLSDRPAYDEAEEQNWDSRARAFHSAARLIDEFSDGVRAYVGILAAVLGTERKLVLLDEPEAFLHPPLARRLGQALSEIAQKRNLNVVVATHSSDFLMGCIEGGVSVNVIRLTYDGAVGTARHLPAEDLKQFMLDPLLRSNDLLRGIFCEAVVATESDNDRAFYAEINHRLQEQATPEGSPSCIFIAAQNKQTIRRQIEPLRRLGIPAAAVVDIDVLKDGGKTWSGLLAAAGVPVAMHAGLGTIRTALLQAFEASGKDMKRDGGVGVLKKPDAEAFDNLRQQLERYGIFVVPIGELESWLSDLGIRGKAPAWVIDVFSAMGSDPTSPTYIKPSKGDVWDFLRTIARWHANPQRAGVPLETIDSAAG